MSTGPAARAIRDTDLGGDDLRLALEVTWRSSGGLIGW